MSKKFVIHDTADVIIKSKSSGKVILNAEAQLASISGAISEEDIRGGIGNKKLYKIRTDKDISLTVRSAFGDMEYWAMTQGAEIEDSGEVTVTKTLKLPVTATQGQTNSFEVTIPTSVTATSFILSDKVGKQATVTATSSKISVPAAFDLKAGDTATLFYSEEITGRKISIHADKFSEKYEIEYRTIAYDPETAEIYSDIYFVFPNVLPSGEFEISLESGSAYTPEINFSVLSGAEDSLYAEIIEDVRA